MENIKVYLKFINNFLKETDKILIKNFSTNLKVNYKIDESPVTKIDKLIEKKFRTKLKKDFPEHSVLGEEFNNKNNNSDFCWIVDPIDGTKSFVHGNHNFGTLICLAHRGIPIIGVISCPLLNKKWIGIKNKGAFLNGKKIKKNNFNLSLKNCVVSSSAFTAYKKGIRDNNFFYKLTNKIRYYIFGGDCVQYGLLASGKISNVIENNLKPWDYMALINIIEEAGGIITDWRGKKLTINSDGRVIASLSKKSHNELLKLVKTSNIH